MLGQGKREAAPMSGGWKKVPQSLYLSGLHVAREVSRLALADKKAPARRTYIFR